jgi:integrase
LAAEHRLISMEQWTAPKARRLAEERVTFGQFADTWLDQRDLKPGTMELYRSLLDKQILSTFGPLSLADITPATVRMWFGSHGKQDPAYRARAYQVLRAIFETAVSDGLIAATPVSVAMRKSPQVAIKNTTHSIACYVGVLVANVRVIMVSAVTGHRRRAHLWNRDLFRYTLYAWRAKSRFSSGPTRPKRDTTSTFSSVGAAGALVAGLNRCRSWRSG